MSEQLETDQLEPHALKRCCAALYEQEAVTLLLGDAYHPGGLALTRRLAEAAGVVRGARVLDVASGPGTTAMRLAETLGASVEGIDLGVETVRRAAENALARGLGFAGEGARFTVADAESLPWRGEAFDAVLCECALCSFPDAPAATSEFARVLRSGGRVGLADVVVSRDELPPGLRGPLGWVVCLAGARPVSGYVDLLEEAGLHVLRTESHDDALAELIERVEARLQVLRMSGMLERSGLDVDTALDYAREAREAVSAGVAGYALIVAEKP